MRDFTKILKTNDFPRRFLVKYAYSCAKYAVDKFAPDDEKGLMCLALIEKWLNDPSTVTAKDLRSPAYIAASFYSYATYSAANAITATYANVGDGYADIAAYANAAAEYAIEAYCSAYHSNRNPAKDLMTQMLVDMIKEEFTPLDLILMDIK